MMNYCCVCLNNVAVHNVYWCSYHILESVATDGEGEGAVYLNELFKLSNAVCMM